MVEFTGEYHREKQFCDDYITLDNKNIHSWSHRIWIVQQFNQYEGELEYTEGESFPVHESTHRIH